jgi:hypothetical protein
MRPALVGSMSVEPTVHSWRPARRRLRNGKLGLSPRPPAALPSCRAGIWPGTSELPGGCSEVTGASAPMLVARSGTLRSEWCSGVRLGWKVRDRQGTCVREIGSDALFDSGPFYGR